MTPEDPELDLFVKGVVTEMTVKAGQECTAIRRVIVPEVIADTVLEAISQRLGEGHCRQPGSELVRMVCWRGWTSARRSARRCRLGGPRRTSSSATRTTVDVVDTDNERGAFMGLVLLCARPGASEPHDIEPFGPVAT